MSTGDGESSIVVRPGWIVRVLNSALAIGFLITMILVVVARQPVIVLFCLVAEVVNVRQLTSRVELFETYMVIRNPIRTIRLNWRDVARVDVVVSRAGSFAWIVRATTRSGSHLRMQGTATSRSEAEDIRDMFLSRMSNT